MKIYHILLIPALLTITFDWVKGDELEEIQSNVEYQADRNERLNNELETLKEEIAGIKKKIEDSKETKGNLADAFTALEASQKKAYELELQLKAKQAVVQGFAKGFQEKMPITAGMEIAELKTADGKTLKDVKITRVMGNQASVQHSGGLSTLSIPDLPDYGEKIIKAPDPIDVDAIVAKVISHRPASLANLELFDAIVKAEMKLKEEKSNAARDENRLALSERRKAQEEARRAKEQARIAVKQQIAKGNEDIDKEIEKVREKIAAVKKKQEDLETAYQRKVASYGAARQLSKKEIDERQATTKNYYDMRDKYVEELSQLDRQVLDLMIKKRSTR